MARIRAGVACAQAQPAAGAQKLIADAVTERQTAIASAAQYIAASPDTCGYNTSYSATLPRRRTAAAQLKAG